jgi:hypothetical protein
MVVGDSLQSELVFRRPHGGANIPMNREISFMAPNRSAGISAAAE